MSRLLSPSLNNESHWNQETERGEGRQRDEGAYCHHLHLSPELRRYYSVQSMDQRGQKFPHLYTGCASNPWLPTPTRTSSPMKEIAESVPSLIGILDLRVLRVHEDFQREKVSGKVVKVSSTRTLTEIPPLSLLCGGKRKTPHILID